MNLYIVKNYNVILDVYGYLRDANRRIAVENRIVKDCIKMSNQLQALRTYIETSKNCPVKKKLPHIKINRMTYGSGVIYNFSSFVDVMDYKDCVKETHYGYCQRFNKENRLICTRVELVVKELK